MLITDHTLEENLHCHPQRPLGITLPHLYPTVKHSQSVKTMYSDIVSLEETQMKYFPLVQSQHYSQVSSDNGNGFASVSVYVSLLFTCVNLDHLLNSITPAPCPYPTPPQIPARLPSIQRIWMDLTTS